MGELPERYGGVDEVYALAADMGGMGFISAHHAEILHSNAFINFTRSRRRANSRPAIFVLSSACVYPEFRQTETNVVPWGGGCLPGQPQDAYGWEKLVTERLCTHYHRRLRS